MKTKLLKIAIMFLIITIIQTAFATIGAYATNKKLTTKTNTNTQVESKTSQTSKNVTNVTNKLKETNKKTTSIITDARTDTLNKVYKTIKEAESKIVEEKEETVQSEGIEATLESYVHRSYETIENAEIGSTIVYTIYLRNASEATKTVQLRTNMLEEISIKKANVRICNVEDILEEGETYKGHLTLESAKLAYRDALNITLEPNEEKAIKVEQDVSKYISDVIENKFIITCNNEVIYLYDEKHAVEPAKINAEIKLYVNDVEISSNESLQLKSDDKVQYVINIENNGGTKEQIKVQDVLPTNFNITNVEYLDGNNQLLSESEYSGNIYKLQNCELKAGEGLKILLTVDPNITSEMNVSNFAEIKGTDTRELSTNITSHTMLGEDEVSGYEGFMYTTPIAIERPEETEELMDEELIRETFGDISFQGLEQENATTTRPYDINDIGSNVVIKFAEMFTPSKEMYCVNYGTTFYKWLKIENFYTVYNHSIYRYVNGTFTEELPEDGVGIGNDYNLIDENYNQLAYILSEVDNYGGFTIPGVSQIGDRPDHRLSPIQIAIWKVQGVSDATIIERMEKRLKALGVSQSQIPEIINNLLETSMQIYANAEAYANYVETGKVNVAPIISYNNCDTVEVNGETLVGPVRIDFQNLELTTIIYTNASGETISKTGKYGEILNVLLTNSGTTYDKVYNESGEEIDLSTVLTTDSLDCYFNITRRNFNIAEKTIVKLSMNNQYRKAYFYTLGSVYDGQNIIIGRGVSSIGEYEIEFQAELMSLSGKVWLDIPQGLKPPLPPNGEIDDNEKGIENIKVSLLNETTGAIEKTILTNANGEYEFKDIMQAEYSIIFEYEGMTNVATVGADSKAEENFTINGSNIRTSFNTRFANIRKNTIIRKAYELLTNGNVVENATNYELEYLLSQNGGEYVSELITTNSGIVLPAYKMFAKTTDTYNSTTENITFGLKNRTAGLSLDTDMINAQLNSKGNTDKTSLKNEKTQDNAYITYRVELTNQLSMLSTVNEIVYYYDPNLEYDSAEYVYLRNGEYVSTENISVVEGEPIQINDETYNTLKISGLNIGTLREGETNLVYLTFRADNTNNQVLRGTFVGYGEIISYSIEGGIVDNNSAPENGITEDGSIIDEDDFEESTISDVRTCIMRRILGLLRK